MNSEALAANQVLLREALPDDASRLSELAFRSKAYWGYAPDFMDSCRGELTVTRSDIASRNLSYWVAADNEAICGFYAVEFTSADSFELDALFVEPAYIGTGVGRLLIQHAMALSARLGASRLTIQGDPNASEFYLAAGARQIGNRVSGSIVGRELPLFEIRLR